MDEAIRRHDAQKGVTMSAFYDEMADLAVDLIEEFGQEVAISRTTESDYDPVTGAGGESVTETQTVLAIVLPASKGTVEAFDQRFVSGTLIETNLRAMKIAAKSCEWPPGPGCKVHLNGHDWSMIGATESAPAGIPLVYSASVMR